MQTGAYPRAVETPGYFNAVLARGAPESGTSASRVWPGRYDAALRTFGGAARRRLDSAPRRKPYARSGHGRLHAFALRIATEFGVIARADEVALAVAHWYDARRRELAAEELRSLSRLSRAILCGVSVDSILPQIARAARHHIQAEFVALGRAGVSPMLAESWDGPEEWRISIQQEPFVHMWHRVLDEGREVKLSGEALPVRPSLPLDQAAPALDRVIALPIEVRNRTCGVLMAGVLPSEDSADDVARWEPYALLASSALDQEAARGERTGWAHSMRQIIEESSEYLALVDEQGRIREASRAARTLLRLDSGRTDEVRLEDLFAQGARDAVTEWRERVIRQDSRRGPTFEPPLEAALPEGAVVRLHLRATVEAN